MDQCSSSPFGPWFYCNEEEGMTTGSTSHELRQFLVHTTMELEATVLTAQEEISRKEEELSHMKDMLLMTIKERDEAQSKCQELSTEKANLQQELHHLLQHLQRAAANSFTRIIPSTTTTNHEDRYSQGLVIVDNNSRETNNTPSFSFSSSDTEESSIISEPPINKHQPPPQTPLLPPQITATLVAKRPLPEKGKLLQAVKEAGPLLQTLLLAGPLPQWQHPPPQLDSIEIPPVTIPLPTTPASPPAGGGGGCLTNGNTKKRCLDNTQSNNNVDGYCSVSSPHASCSKYQRVVQSS